MPTTTEWKDFLRENGVPRSKMTSIIDALVTEDAVNVAQIETCAYFDNWWKADPDSFEQYVDANGFDHWLAAHPEFTSGCPT